MAWGPHKIHLSIYPQSQDTAKRPIKYGLAFNAKPIGGKFAVPCAKTIGLAEDSNSQSVKHPLSIVRLELIPKMTFLLYVTHIFCRPRSFFSQNGTWYILSHPRSTAFRKNQRVFYAPLLHGDQLRSKKRGWGVSVCNFHRPP